MSLPLVFQRFRRGMENKNTLESVDTSNSPSSSSPRSPSLPNTSVRNDATTNILFLDSVRVAKTFRSEGLRQATTSEVPQLPSLLSLRPTSPPLSPEPEEQCQKRIPRPPNAFMLYRSYLLKKIHIPSNVERRQQALSCVAGECWNMLAPEEKQKWQTKAAEAYRLHQLKYPGYKFAPSPKGSGRKGKGKSAVSESAVRALREKYVHMPGPAVPPARQRRGKATKNALKADHRSDVETSSEASLTPSLSPVVASSPRPVPVYPFSHAGSDSGEGAALPPEFPSPSLPYYFADRRQMSAGPSSSMSSVDPYFTQLPARPLSVPSSLCDMAFHRGLGGYFTPSFSNDGYHYTETYGAIETNPCTRNIDPLHYMIPFTTVDPNATSEQPFQCSLTANEAEIPSLVPTISSSPSDLYAFSTDDPLYLTFHQNTYDN